MNKYAKKFALKYYDKNVGFYIRDYNKVFPMPYYFNHVLGKHGTHKIADLCAGPVCRLGGKKAGTKIEIYASDVLAEEYKELVKKHFEELLIPVEYQDVENLTYPDEFFDIVHCVNGLDHTEDIKKALSEIHRVCKKGGWIYLRHSPDQKKLIGTGHYWNATLEGFNNGEEFVKLDGFEISTNSGFIIATKYK